MFVCVYVFMFGDSCFYSTLTRNIRHRRGEKVVINVPSKLNLQRYMHSYMYIGLYVSYVLWGDIIFKKKRRGEFYVLYVPHDYI